VTVRPRRIGHIGLVSTDLERLVAWYEEVLGFQVSDRMPYPDDAPFYEGVWMRCNSDHHVVSLFGLREVPERPHDPRAFKVPGFPVTPILSILACAYILASLHWYTWVIFAGWVAVFLVFYMLYGRKHSVLGQERGEEPVVEEK
jgi:hypothetical protein